MRAYTLAELEVLLGVQLKRIRLLGNIDQKTLAAQAGVSPRALQSLEAGTGSTVRTLLSVVRSLEREEWLERIAPMVTVNPMTMTKSRELRQRASARKPRSS